MSLRGRQTNCSLFSEEDNNKFKQIKGLAQEGATTRNQASYVEIFMMVFVKGSDKLEGSGYKIYALSCGGLYK